MGFFFNLHPFHRKKSMKKLKNLWIKVDFIISLLTSCHHASQCETVSQAMMLISTLNMSMQINEHKEYLRAREDLEPFPWIFQLKTFLLSQLRLSTWYSLARRHRKKPLLLVSLIQLSRTSFSTGKMSVTLITFSSFKPSLEDLVKKATDWLLVKQHAKQQHCLAWKK